MKLSSLSKALITIISYQTFFSNFRQSTRGWRPDEATEELVTAQQTQIKQGWSLLATLHCVLLPDKVSSPQFKKPQIEMMARRWQHHCLEVQFSINLKRLSMITLI